jgi:hypothetical protein
LSTVTTTSPRPLLGCCCSRAFLHPPTAPRLYSVSWITPARWRNSAMSENAPHPLVTSVQLEDPRYSRFSPRNRLPDNRTPPEMTTLTLPAGYHRRFGDRAQHSTQPCANHQQRKLAQQTSTSIKIIIITALFIPIIIIENCTNLDRIETAKRETIITEPIIIMRSNH